MGAPAFPRCLTAIFCPTMWLRSPRNVWIFPLGLSLLPLGIHHPIAGAGPFLSPRSLPYGSRSIGGSSAGFRTCRQRRPEVRFLSRQAHARRGLCRDRPPKRSRPAFRRSRAAFQHPRNPLHLCGVLEIAKPERRGARVGSAIFAEETHAAALLAAYRTALVP